VIQQHKNYGPLLKDYGLAKIKEGTVTREKVFDKTAENFISYCQPFVSLMKKLRKAVFLRDKLWKEEDRRLYSQMKEILRKVMEDPEIVADWTG
jgi:hypothetical protein